MDFCPRCGRFLKDNEYQCPECGNMVRSPPMPEQVPPQYDEYYRSAGTAPISLSKLIFEKYFFIALAICFAIAFSITYMWRFSFLFFCIPLLIPMGRFSISFGALAGMSLGTVAALLVKYFMLGSAV